MGLLCFGLCLVVLGCVCLLWVVFVFFGVAKCRVRLFLIVVGCFALFDLVLICLICRCIKLF